MANPDRIAYFRAKKYMFLTIDGEKMTNFNHSGHIKIGEKVAWHGCIYIIKSVGAYSFADFITVVCDYSHRCPPPKRVTYVYF